MITYDKQQILADVSREIGRIAVGGGTFQDITKTPDFRAFTPAPPDSRLKEEGRTAAPAERGPFGRWLLQQKDREGFIGMLARAARRDPAFPADGDPETVRKRLNAQGADADMHEALDDAELDWASY